MIEDRKPKIDQSCKSFGPRFPLKRVLNSNSTTINTRSILHSMADGADAASKNSRHTRTVFVRNLPYSADEKKLSEIFGEVGPVQRCYDIKDKGMKYEFPLLRG